MQRGQHVRCSSSSEVAAAPHRGRRLCPVCHSPALPRLPWHERGASLRDATGLEPVVPDTGMQVAAEVRRKQRAAASRVLGGLPRTRSFLRSPGLGRDVAQTHEHASLGYIVVLGVSSGCIRSSPVREAPSRDVNPWQRGAPKIESFLRRGSLYSTVAKCLAILEQRMARYPVRREYVFGSPARSLAILCS